MAQGGGCAPLDSSVRDFTEDLMDRYPNVDFTRIVYRGGKLVDAVQALNEARAAVRESASPTVVREKGT